MLQKSTSSNWVSSATASASNLTLGLAISVAVASTSVHATGPEIGSSSRLDTTRTTIARAISATVNVQDKAPIELAQLSHSEEMPDRRVLLSRSRELMEADNREVDAVAARLKAIIEARYLAEAQNAKSLATIEELQAKIAEFEALLRKSKMRQQMVNADKDALEDRLAAVMAERDNALEDLDLMGNQVQQHLGSVQQLKSATEAADLALADKQQEIEDLNAKLADLMAARDAALARGDNVENDLLDNQKAMDELQQQLADLAAEKERADNALAASQAILNERENKLARLNDLMTDKSDEIGFMERQLGDNAELLNDLESKVGLLGGERDQVKDELNVAKQQLAGIRSALDAKTDQLKGLQAQLGQVTDERDAARNELAMVEGRLADRLAEIASLEGKMDNLGTQRAGAMGQIGELQKKLALAENSASNFMNDRDSLAEKLKLWEGKAADAGNSFAAEQQKHTKTRANLASLRREADGLRQSIEQLNGEKTRLLDEAGQLNASRAELNGQLLATKKELETRQNELKSALSAIANLNRSIAELGKERDVLAANVDELNNQVVAMKSRMDNSNSEYEDLLADNASKHAAQLKALEKELTAKNQSIALLNKDIEGLNADLTNEQNRAAGFINGKDNEIADLNARLAALTDTREQLKLARQKGNQEISALKSNIDQLNSVNGELKSSLADANSQFDRFRSDSEAQLAQLEKEIMDLTGTRDSQAEQIAKLEGLNQRLGQQLEERSDELELVTAQSAQKIQGLNAAIDKLLTSEKRYKASLLETGEKLQQLAGENQSMASELAAERALTASLQQDLGEYETQLSFANQKLDNMMAAQRQAEAERDRIAAEAEQLRVSLTDELDKARLENITVQKARADNSIPIRLGNADFFETGSATLTRAGGEKLTQLANIIHSYHNRRIVVEGHTDNVPIGPSLLSRYASNWELSVARATAAVRHMQKETDIDPVNLSAAGYGEFKPVGDNESVEGRQQNRRVEVVLYPRESKFKDAENDLNTITVIDE